jgi:hypothetical protein
MDKNHLMISDSNLISTTVMEAAGGPESRHFVLVAATVDLVPGYTIRS